MIQFGVRMSAPRVRIAPSPSGILHIGTAKIALMNWLYARKTGGTFILRLEDTDASRTEEEFALAMQEGFRWLGIDWDEGPPFGDEPEKGDRGPYRQTQRKEQHHAAVRKLLDSGKAYKCFCSQEELDAVREKAQAEKRPAKLCQKCRNLSPAEIAAKGDASFVARFKVPADGVTVVDDLVQGRVEKQNSQIDDFVIARSTGEPLFHLAVVDDDGQMAITHIIRGDDHLTNANKHVMLFEALGYPLPKFAHLPLVHDEKGKKFSKRDHGANVLDWREDGYLPDALVNYVALLGWSAGDDRELYTRDELIQAFSLERLGQSAGRFDLKRLQWLNGQHIRLLTPEALRDLLIPVLQRNGLDASTKSPEWLARMAAICQEKLTTLNDITPLVDFFFHDIREYEEKAVAKQWRKPGAAEQLEKIRDLFAAVNPWDASHIKETIERQAETDGSGLGPFVHPARLALTGKSVGPGLFELAELLGKETALQRIDCAIGFVRGL